MDGGESDAAPVRPGRGRAFSRHTDWLAVAIVGAIVFAVGIYAPATAWIHGPRSYGTDWIAVAVALAGGVLAGLGLSKWYDLRPGGPAARRAPPKKVDLTRASNLPSFEVYGPAPSGRRGSRRPKG